MKLRFLLVVLAGLLCQCASDPGMDARQAAVLRSRAAQKGLVEVRRVIPEAVVDLRYGTARNVTGQVLYPKGMPCLLHHKTAEKLLMAQRLLSEQGYRLVIWDAWRPPEVQLALHAHGGHTGMFADPKLWWSRHCSGTAVDVSLADAQGRLLRLPTGFDEGGPDSSYLYMGMDEGVRRRLLALQMAMVRAGFLMLDTEWWHFDDREFHQAPLPPVVFAADLGLVLPKVRKPARR